MKAPRPCGDGWSCSLGEAGYPRYLPSSGLRRCRVSGESRPLSDQIASASADWHEQGFSARADTWDIERRISSMAFCVDLLDQLGLVEAGRVRPPAVVVGRERHQRVAELRLTGQLGLRHHRHPDQGRAPAPVELALGPGGELGPFHADVGAALVDADREAGAALDQGIAQSAAERRGQLDVHGQVFEEGAGPAAGPVDHLVGDDQVLRGHFLAEAAHGAAGDHVGHAEGLEGVDVGPIGDLRRVEQVPFPVAGEQRHRHPGDLGQRDRPGGTPKRGIDLADLALPKRAERLAQAGAADDADDDATHVRPPPVPARASSLPRTPPWRCASMTKKEPARVPGGLRRKMRQRPTLPHGFPCSTIGSGGLNFRVRDGNGCDPTDIATAKR
jgi:hypothetical protein